MKPTEKEFEGKTEDAAGVIAEKIAEKVFDIMQKKLGEAKLVEVKTAGATPVDVNAAGEVKTAGATPVETKL